MKEVNFSFFTSVRFLGLGLKILFHKNKEIKRMLSKKMTFSLMSLITILALAFVADDAFAAKKPFEIKITGPASATHATLNSQVMVDLIVESAHAIPNLVKVSGTAGNVEVTAIGREGSVVASPTITVVDRLIAVYPMRTSTKRQLRITVTQQADLVETTKGRIASVVVKIIGGVETTDPTVLATDGTDTELNISKVVFHTITLVEGPPENTSRPQVVSIQRLRPGSQTVVAAFQEAEVTGAFDVRIVTTELPHDFKIDFIEVTNGTKSGFVVGVPFARFPATGNANLTYRPASD